MLWKDAEEKCVSKTAWLDVAAIATTGGTRSHLALVNIIASRSVPCKSCLATAREATLEVRAICVGVTIVGAFRTLVDQGDPGQDYNGQDPNADV
jgi:hypothetical protein